MAKVKVASQPMLLRGYSFIQKEYKRKRNLWIGLDRSVRVLVSFWKAWVHLGKRKGTILPSSKSKEPFK